MNLPISTIGSDSGLQWEENLNASQIRIDAHNHSPGYGVPITPNGMNIDDDLPFNDHNATLLRSARFQPQASPLANAGLDVGCLYVSGNEVYYNDVSGGNQVQITNNGSVNAGAGSITGLPSGTASASFSAGTFIWQASTNTPANMDFASAILRNNTANSKGLTLSPPAAMAADYGLTLPPLPVATSFATLDTSGNFAATIPIVGGITNPFFAAGTQIPVVIKSKSAAYTVLTTDGLILCDTSTAFTLTMYTAVGNSGLSLRVRKTTSDFNPLTISLVGGSTTTTTLDTIGEEVLLVSDNSNWIIVSRTIPSVWVAGTFGVTGGLAASGPASQNSFVKRIGDSLQCRVAIVLGNTSAATGAVTLPSGLTIDTAKVAAGSAPGSVVGQSVCSRLSNLYETGSRRQEVAVTSGGGSVYLSVLGSGGTLGSLATINSVFGGGDGLHMDFLVPITGWNG